MKIIDEIIRREGGYVNHPADKGGATNFGVTLATLAAWRGHPVSEEDVRDMPRSEAVDIYNDQYVKPFRFAADSEVFEHLVDCAVNHGVGGATKLLQRALGVAADGAFGPNSLAAWSAADKKKIYFALIRERAAYFARIVKNNPSQSVFIEGWIRRAMEFLPC